MNILDNINQHFFSFLKQQFSLNDENLKPIELILNTDVQKKQFGDFNSNAALILAKKLGMSPRQIAQTIRDNFSSNKIEKIEIAGPGFINLFFTYQAIQELGRELYEKKSNFFKPENSDVDSINLEFVSANPTGPLHIGHGRGGIMGDVLGNVLSFLANKVTKEYYINDAGSQITKLGESLLIRIKQELGQDIKLPEESYHGNYLIEIAKKCIDENGSEVVNNDLNFFKTYAKNMLLERIDDTLTEYGITFDEWFSEQTLHDSGEIAQGIEILNKNGHIFEKDDALWFRSTTFGDDKDRVLRKKDGSYTYVAADIGYMLNKINRGHNKLIIILGQDHHSYVQRLKGLLEALGHNPDQINIPLYQLVTLKESGEQLRMSKRAGRMVTLRDVIETVGKDVARFFYLNKKADAHLEFDIDLAMKKTDENPVYYLQYAYVRTKSIIEKANEVLEPIGHEHATLLGHEETLLLKKIASLRTLLATIGKNYQTQLLTYYLLDLAQSFHRYYSSHRVIDPESMQTSQGRLFLVHLVKQTLKFGFDLIGISTPEKM